MRTALRNSQVAILTALLAAATAGCGIPLEGDEGFESAEQQLQLSFTPVADAEAVQASPTKNLGSAVEFGSDKDPSRQAFLRFNVSGVAGKVTSAKLRCYLTNGSVDGPALYATSATWTESTLNWNNRPATTGGALGDVKAAAYHGWLEYDVTSRITGNGAWGFALIPTSTDSAVCASREASANRPQLIVQYTPAPVVVDAGTPVVDAGTPVVVDAGTPVVDAGSPNTSGVPSASILPPLPAGATLQYSEEFTDDTAWRTMFKPYQNNYMEPNGIKNYWLTKNVTTVPSEGGFLRLTGLKENYTVSGKTYGYTSGMVGSRDTGHYFTALGRYAFAARLPHGHAEWTCIWLRHRSGSSVLEVDLNDQFEAQKAGSATNAVHKPATEKMNLLNKPIFIEDPFAAPQWHVYSVDIIQVSAGVVDFNFYLDGKLSSTYRDLKASSWLGQAPLDQAFDIAIDHKIGGTWSANPDMPYTGFLSNGTKGVPAGTIPESKYPSNYDIGWIKVWKY